MFLECEHPHPYSCEDGVNEQLNKVPAVKTVPSLVQARRLPLAITVTLMVGSFDEAPRALTTGRSFHKAAHGLGRTGAITM